MLFLLSLSENVCLYGGHATFRVDVYKRQFQDIRDTCAGIEESLKGGCEVEYLILAGDEHKKEEQISKRLAKGDIHAVMALGCSELEILGRVYKKETSLNKVMIYGMGKNNDIRADMEEGLIQAVGVINYYSIGYLSVQEVVDVYKRQGRDRYGK